MSVQLLGYSVVRVPYRHDRTYQTWRGERGTCKARKGTWRVVCEVKGPSPLPRRWVIACGNTNTDTLTLALIDLLWVGRARRAGEIGEGIFKTQADRSAHPTAPTHSALCPLPSTLHLCQRLLLLLTYYCCCSPLPLYSYSLSPAKRLTL